MLSRYARVLCSKILHRICISKLLFTYNVENKGFFLSVYLDILKANYNLPLNNVKKKKYEIITFTYLKKKYLQNILKYLIFNSR